jgi:hypothetical protein
MTNRKQDLIELRDKVMAGEAFPHDAPQRKRRVAEHECLGGYFQDNMAYGAFHGSLDAAKALHEAVLPGWVASPQIGGKSAGVTVWHCTLEDWESGQEISVNNIACPARAWLLAVLEALIAQEDAV